MKPVRDETLAAIRSDEFAMAALDCAIRVIYAHHRDWHHITRSGKILFDSEEAKIAYDSLCTLTGQTEPPHIEGKVNVGGGNLSMSAIDMLQEAFARKS